MTKTNDLGLIYNKEELRKNYLKVRSTIVDKIERSNKLLSLLVRLKKFRSSNTILLYYSTANEVYTYNIAQYCIAKNKRLLFPYIDRVEVGEVTRLQDFRSKGKFKEPLRAISDENLNIDFAIIPGLIFDDTGNRIGYGNGWYDRFFVKHPETFKLGVCFAEQLYPGKLESEIHDIKMDKIISV